MDSIQCYNTKLIDYGNGNKQIITYQKPIPLDTKKEKEIPLTPALLDSVAIEKKALHSLFTSCNRSKNEVFKIARSNEWEWFITLTFNRKMVTDRTDYDSILEKLRKWFNNLKQRKSPNMRYLLIPEQHKKVEDNGLRAWHFHGLLADCPELHLYLLDNIRYAKKSNTPVYSIREYKLGFNTATAVKNNEAVTRYISKYITKSLVNQTKGKRRYIASNNCNKPKEYRYFLQDICDLTDMSVPFDNDVYLNDLVDFEKCVWHKEKKIECEDFQNIYTYYEFKEEFTPILKNGQIN